MKRTPITKLVGEKIVEIRFSDDYASIVFLGENEKILFGVTENHLFDAKGFYFNVEDLK